jgi:hypothetical protein
MNKCQKPQTPNSRTIKSFNLHFQPQNPSSLHRRLEQLILSTSHSKKESVHILDIQARTNLPTPQRAQNPRLGIPRLASCPATIDIVMLRILQTGKEAPSASRALYMLAINLRWMRGGKGYIHDIQSQTCEPSNRHHSHSADGRARARRLWMGWSF